MGIKEMLAQHATQQKTLAAQGAGVKPTEVSNVVSGMQSSAEKAAILAEAPPPIKGEVDKERAAASLAVYEDNDFRPLKKIIRSKGGKTHAHLGFFYAKDEDDVKVLDQYAARSLVTKLEPQAELALDADKDTK